MTTPSREQRIESILHTYLQAMDRGEKPDRQAILDAHADLRDELAEYFVDASKLERMAKSLKTASFGEPVGVSPRILEPSSLGKIRYFGDYELLDEIARGGMGVVYRAKQVSLNRVVALKMILKGEFASEADVRRFRQEAEAAANLDHPNIVPIYEVGEHEGQQYFSMKLISVVASGDWRAASKYGQRKVAATVAKVARAVHHAHQRGILHRDLKPSNILIDQNGEPHVADFGLAKKVEGGDDATKSGAIVGTPAYMAPEQARAEKSLTTAVDVWSLGAILYEWLTGRPPFRGDDALSTLMKVSNEEPTPPRKINLNIDRDLETICLKSLEKDSTKRYGSAEALAEDLERWGRGEPIHARPIGRIERTVRWCRRNKLVTSACLLAVLGFGVGVFFGVRGQMQEQRRLQAELLQAEELRRQQLILSAKFARLAGQRKTALIQIQEAAKHGSTKQEDLHSELFLSLAAPALRHHGQSQIMIGNLTPPFLAFANDSKSVFLEYGGTRMTLPVPAIENLRKEEVKDWRLINVLPEFKKPIDDKLFVRAVNAPVTFALLQRAVPGESHDISLWDIAQQKNTGSLPGPLGTGAVIALSADGRRAAFSNPYATESVHVWDFSESRIVVTLSAGRHAIGMPLRFAAGFSPDGSLLALHGKIDGEPALLVFEINTGRLIGSAKNDPHVSKWSPDGRWLASWGTFVSTGVLEAGATNNVGNHAHSPNVLLLSELVHPVTGWQSENQVNHLEFSRDGKLLVADRMILRTIDNPRSMCLDLVTGQLEPSIGFEAKAGWELAKWEFAPRTTGRLQQQLLTITQPTVPFVPTIKLSHPGFSDTPFAGKDKTTVARPNYFAHHPDGKKLVAVFFLDRREGRPANLREAKTEYSLESWDIEQGKRIAIWNSDSSERFASVDFALGGECVLTSSDQGVKQWDAKTGQVIRQYALPIQPDLRGGDTGDKNDGSLHLWWEFNQPSPLIIAHGGKYALIMTHQDMNAPNDKRNVYERIDLRTGAKDGATALSKYGPLALSPDGRMVAEAISGGIRLHDLETGKSLSWETSGRENSVIAFHPGGEVLATADSTGLVRLWHLGWIRNEAEKMGNPLPVLTR